MFEIQITKNASGENVVSARDLHYALKIETKFNDWIKRMFDYGFKENLDYSKLSIDNQNFNYDYALTLEMAKNLTMIQRTEIGMMYRKYFIDCEKKLMQAYVKPKSRLELARENLALIEEIEEKERLLQESKPKVEFFDQVTNSRDAVDMGTIAKVLGYPNLGRNKLFKILRDMKILMEDNKPYQSYIDQGWFRVIETKYTKPNSDVCIGFKTLVHQKGINAISKKLNIFLK